MTRKIRQLNRISRQGRQSALALTLCLALALGVGLLAANPAAALVVYTSVNQTYAPQNITLSVTDLTNGTFPTINPVYVINPYGGTPVFQIDAVNLNIVSGSVTAQVSGLFNNIEGNANYPVGSYISTTIDFGTLNNLIAGLPTGVTPIDIPVIQNLTAGTSIGAASSFLNNPDSPLKTLLGFDLGGFTAEVHININPFLQSILRY